MRNRAMKWIGAPLAALFCAAAAPVMSAARSLATDALPETRADARTFADEALDRIVEAVQKRYNARVVKVTEVMVDGRRAYELRLLSDQRVWTVRVDAETGQELSRND